jgi:hypothetical protein
VESSVGFAGGVGVKGAAAEDAEKKLVRNLHVLKVFSSVPVEEGDCRMEWFNSKGISTLILWMFQLGKSVNNRTSQMNRLAFRISYYFIWCIP